MVDYDSGYGEGGRDERAMIVAWLKGLGAYYSTEIFSEPPPVSELTDEQKKTRTRESAAALRWATSSWAGAIERGEHVDAAESETV